jgi:adenylate cyclase
MRLSRNRPIILFSLASFLLAVWVGHHTTRLETAASDGAIVLRYYLNRNVLGAIRPYRRPGCVQLYGESEGMPAAAANEPWQGSPLISDEICLIGIDTPSLQATGRYGSGQWVVRTPFLQMTEVLQEAFRPSVVAWDIVFHSVTENETAAQGSEAFSPESIENMVALLENAMAHGLGGESYKTLLLMAQFAADLSEYRLASAFAELSHGSISGRKGIPVIAAFVFRGIHDAAVPSWRADDVAGSAASGRRSGKSIPYLTDVAIPSAQVTNVPYDYPYAHNARLPSLSLRDYISLGFINVDRDQDGVIRRAPVILGFQYADPETGEAKQLFVPSFFLLSVLYHWQLTPRQVDVEFGDEVRVYRRDGKVVRIPIDAKGNMRLNMVGKTEDFPSVSLWCFLRAGAAELHGGDAGADGSLRNLRKTVADTVNKRIAMVGLTAEGTTDIGPTALSPDTPYVQVHLSAANSILTDRFLGSSTVADAVFLALLFLLYTTVCCSGSLGRFSWGTVASLLLAVSVYYGAVHFHLGLLPATIPAVYLGTAYISVLLFRYFAQERSRREIRQMFSKMVSADVLRYVEERSKQAVLSGQRAEATVMFSDLANFTRAAETMAPERLSELLNSYFAEMADIIMAHGGYVDKFEGDAIMAEWGVPYPRADHAVAACLAALEQRDRLVELREKWAKRFGVELQARFGLSSGLVAAGNMGSAERFQYTVIGSVVNIAARLEPANKDYGTSIIISESTYRAASDLVEARLLDRIVVAGSTEPVAAYELLCKKGGLGRESRQLVRHYEQALEYYWARRWSLAEASVGQALFAVPGDGPASRLLERIRYLAKNPPPESWRGEFIQSEKL